MVFGGFNNVLIQRNITLYEIKKFFPLELFYDKYLSTKYKLGSTFVLKISQFYTFHKHTNANV